MKNTGVVQSFLLSGAIGKMIGPIIFAKAGKLKYQNNKMIIERAQIRLIRGWST